MDDGMRGWLFAPVMGCPVASRVAVLVATDGAESRTTAPHGEDRIG